MYKKTIDYYLKSTWQGIANKYNVIASHFGITQAMGYVLINIHKEGTSVSQLANSTGVKPTSLSRLLRNLESLGLIFRKTNQQDKRSVKVFLTAVGIEKREVAKQIVRDFNMYLENHLGVQETEALMTSLHKLDILISEYSPQINEEDFVKVNGIIKETIA
ncbi:MAG TPA: MarR family transcriptional regulator [Sphingobacterium sp.]|nr:MarR family transcriptional regulator [Sphingobacterium sp.]